MQIRPILDLIKYMSHSASWCMCENGQACALQKIQKRKYIVIGIIKFYSNWNGSGNNIILNLQNLKLDCKFKVKEFVAYFLHCNLKAAGSNGISIGLLKILVEYYPNKFIDVFIKYRQKYKSPVMYNDQQTIETVIFD